MKTIPESTRKKYKAGIKRNRQKLTNTMDYPDNLEELYFDWYEKRPSSFADFSRNVCRIMTPGNLKNRLIAMEIWRKL